MYVTEARQNSGMSFLLNPSVRPPSGPNVIGVVEEMVAPDVPVRGSHSRSPILDREEGELEKGFLLRRSKFVFEFCLIELSKFPSYTCPNRELRFRTRLSSFFFWSFLSRDT